jgi:hypothetical protein
MPLRILHTEVALVATAATVFLTLEVVPVAVPADIQVRAAQVEHFRTTAMQDPEAVEVVALVHYMMLAEVTHPVVAVV